MKCVCVYVYSIFMNGAIEQEKNMFRSSKCLYVSVCFVVCLLLLCSFTLFLFMLLLMLTVIGLGCPTFTKYMRFELPLNPKVQH